MARVIRVFIAFLCLALCGPALCRVVFVDGQRPPGGPAPDGTTWASAYRGVAPAMLSAQSGDEVWVAQGQYVESVVLKAGVGVYGGFQGVETTRAARDPAAFPAVVRPPTTTEPAVSAPRGLSATAVLNGFLVESEQRATTGVMIVESGPTIENNTIRNFQTGVNCASTGGALVLRNTVSETVYGVLCTGASPTIAGNVFTANTYAIHTQKTSSPLIAHNTLVDNQNALDLFTGAPVVSGNLVAFQQEVGVFLGSGGTPTLRRNCVFGNGMDYQGLPNPTGADGNISVDPLLRNAPAGDFRLAPQSPCEDAGDDVPPAALATDRDGRPRRVGAAVDIGAYETASVPGTSLEDVRRALRLAAGLEAGTTDDMARLNVVTSGNSVNHVDLRDAAHLARALRL